MKKWGLFVVFVFWNVTFSNDGGKTWQTTRRQRGFDNWQLAQKFVDRAPAVEYECVDSITGTFGRCKLSEFVIQGAS